MLYLHLPANETAGGEVFYVDKIDDTDNIDNKRDSNR